jgi:hypothetical protein
VHFHAAGQAAAGKGELELRELLARPDPDGGEVPDRVVGPALVPPPPRESPALLRCDSLYPGPIGNMASAWGDILVPLERGAAWIGRHRLEEGRGSLRPKGYGRIQGSI